MNKSRQKERLETTEVATSAMDLWHTFYGLVGWAAGMGFTLKEKRDDAVILENPTSGAKVSVRVITESGENRGVVLEEIAY